MRVFVTGITGTIGPHLSSWLSRHDVLCLCRKSSSPTDSGFQVLHGDLDAPESYGAALQRFRPDSCIHLGWSGIPDYSLHHCNSSLVAGLNLFKALGRAGCRRVFASGTCWEYGKLVGPVAEDDRAEALSLFPAFKSALQIAGQSICEQFGIQLLWGRLFFAYGPGQRATSLIPSCYRSFRGGLAPKIANPLAVNDFVHVSDVSEGIRTLIEGNMSAGIYNIGSGKPVPVWEIVNLVAAQMGISPVYHDMDVSASGFWADTGKSHAAGWSARITLQDGIAQSVRAMDGNND